jgi:O-acetyl-ADP-ribose deacetylase (regulator of RNase III)
MSIKPQLHALQGDITKIKADAIVNAANSSLMGGGGVDGAIHRAGGPAILEACKQIVAKQGTCNTGEAVITTAGNLSAKFVIHTVGPVWQGGRSGEAQKLAACYKNSLQLAVENNCKTIAFPGISTGIYGYPKEAAAAVAVTTVRDFFQNKAPVEQVFFVCFDAESLRLMQAQITKLLS